MKPLLTLDALEVVESIERKGSFAAAAAILNKVPSAVSYTVQKLEQDLGVTLFQKQGRRAVLTPAGQLLVEQGRLLLAAAEELAAATRQVATGWEPRLRIAVDTVVPLDAVLAEIGALYAVQPGIEIQLMTEVLGGTWEALVDGRAELVVGGLGGVPGHKGIRCEPWRQMDHVFVAAPGHPICKVQQPVSVDILLRYRSVVISDTSSNSAPLSRGILNKHGALVVPTMEAKIQAHRLGLGIGYLPESQVVEDLATGRLVALHIQEQREKEPLMLAWKTSNRGQALRFLLERLRNSPAHSLGYRPEAASPIAGGV